MRACWNRQTGKLEVLVFEWTCGFKSHRSHHFSQRNFEITEKMLDFAGENGYNKFRSDVRVVDLADSLDSGSSVHYARAGSSPASRTNKKSRNQSVSGFFVAIFQLFNNIHFSNANPLHPKPTLHVESMLNKSENPYQKRTSGSHSSVPPLWSCNSAATFSFLLAALSVERTRWIVCCVLVLYATMLLS